MFASAVIDYDYIMGLIDNITDDKPSKQKMTRQQVIDLICSSSSLMDEGLNEKAIHQGYEQFKVEKSAKELTVMAEKQYTLVPTLPRGNAYGA